MGLCPGQYAYFDPWKDLIPDAGAQNLQVIQRGSDTIYQSSGHRAAVLPV